MEFPHDIPLPEVLDRLDAGELDALPFGLLELDAVGVIRRVNRAEASRTGLAREDFLGRNFFEEIAPCTNVREFAGEFRDGVRRGSLRRTFVFRYPSPAGWRRVIVHIMISRLGYGWVLATLEAGRVRTDPPGPEPLD